LNKEDQETGHFGTGDLEISIKSDEDFKNTKALIIKPDFDSYRITKTDFICKIKNLSRCWISGVLL